MGVIRLTGVPCSRCGERTWYRREPEEKRLTRGNLLAVALFPVRLLDLSLSYLSGRNRAGVAMAARMGDANRVSESSGYSRQVREILKAEGLRKPDRVKGVDPAPGEVVCASCGYTYRDDVVQ